MDCKLNGHNVKLFSRSNAASNYKVELWLEDFVGRLRRQRPREQLLHPSTLGPSGDVESQVSACESATITQLFSHLARTDGGILERATCHVHTDIIANTARMQGPFSQIAALPTGQVQYAEGLRFGSLLSNPCAGV